MAAERKLAVIIEDDPDVRNLLRAVLTQSGFETILTSNGEDGVAAVQMHEPVLTTLDVSMPGMDGVAAAAAIRSFSDTYIIMITAQDDEIDIISGLNAGADEYLSKPFRPRELRARIASLMRRPRSGAAAPEPEVAQVDDGLWRRPADVTSQAPAQVQATPTMPVQVQGLPVQALPTQALPTQALPVQAVPMQAVPAEAVPMQAAPMPVTPTVAHGAPVQTAPVYPSQAQPHQQVPSMPSPQYPQQGQQGFAAVPPAPAQPASSYAAQPSAYAPQAAAVSPAAGQSLAVSDGQYAYDGLVLTVETGEVLADGRPVDLIHEEFDLLRTLMSTGRRVRSKADLVLAARGESYVTSYFVTEQDKRQIDRHIASLRRKLHDEVDPGRWIETVAGVGYRMAM